MNLASNPVPTLTQVAPSSTSQGSGDTTVTLTGTGFVPTSSALFDGAPTATTFVTATQIAATIPAIDLTSAQTHQLSVTTPPPGGGTSGQLPFTVTAASVNPVPGITSISPTSTPLSTVDVQIAITGSSFIAASSAAIGAQGIATHFVSATQLLADIPSSYLSAAGTLQIGVFNPAPGGGFSPTAVPVTVGTPNPVPTLTSLTPASVNAGSADLTLTLAGSNLVAGCEAFFGTTALATTFVNATSATVLVPAGLVSAPGSTPVVLVNPTPGGGVSAAIQLIVEPSSGNDGGADAATDADAAPTACDLLAGMVLTSTPTCPTATNPASLAPSCAPSAYTTDTTICGFTITSPMIAYDSMGTGSNLTAPRAIRSTCTGPDLACGTCCGATTGQVIWAVLLSPGTYYSAASLGGGSAYTGLVAPAAAATNTNCESAQPIGVPGSASYGPSPIGGTLYYALSVSTQTHVTIAIDGSYLGVGWDGAFAALSAACGAGMSLGQVESAPNGYPASPLQLTLAAGSYSLAVPVSVGSSFTVTVN